MLLIANVRFFTVPREQQAKFKLFLRPSMLAHEIPRVAKTEMGGAMSGSLSD